MEEEIAKLIEERGPLTGAEMIDALNHDPFLLWRTCKLSKSLHMMTVGTKYLRLDRRVDGYARLSPSILRGFLTYSAIGLSSDKLSLIQKANKILTHIEEVSRAKAKMAIITTIRRKPVPQRA